MFENSRKARIILVIAAPLVVVIFIGLTLYILLSPHPQSSVHPRPTNHPQSMDWRINDVTGDGATYFTASNSTVTAGYTCDNLNYDIGETALRIWQSNSGKEIANLSINTKPYPFFCNAATYRGTTYAPLKGNGASMSGIGAYKGPYLLWTWNLPSSMTAVEELTADQSGVYALLGNGNTAEFHGTPPTALRLVHLVTGHTTTAKPVVTFNVPIKLRPSGWIPSLTHYTHGLALAYLAYTVGENRLDSLQYVGLDGTITAPISFGSNDYVADTGIAMSDDGSLFTTRINDSPQCVGSMLLPAMRSIRKYDKVTGHTIDYKLPYICSSVYSIHPLPNGDMIAEVEDSRNLGNWSLVRLKSGGGIVWTKQLNGSQVGIDTKGAIVIENLDIRNNKIQIVMIDPTSGSTKVLHAWTLKTSTDNNSVAYLFVGPNRVYVVIWSIGPKGKSDYTLYSLYVSGLGESYQG